MTKGSIRRLPPSSYWMQLLDDLPYENQIEELRALSENRVNEFTPSDLPPPWESAKILLDRVTENG